MGQYLADTGCKRKSETRWQSTPTAYIGVAQWTSGDKQQYGTLHVCAAQHAEVAFHLYYICSGPGQHLRKPFTRLLFASNEGLTELLHDPGNEALHHRHRCHTVINRQSEARLGHIQGLLVPVPRLREGCHESTWLNEASVVTVVQFWTISMPAPQQPMPLSQGHQSQADHRS
jgi:hypothetical protein